MLKNMSNILKRAEQYNQDNSSIEWCEKLDISSLGKVVGIGGLQEIVLRGSCFCIIHEDESIPRVDVYSNGKRVNYKRFEFDSKGRVIKNMMYEPDGVGGWHCVDDIWYYTYDNVTGLRTTKLMKKPDARSGRELTYNKEGKAIKETIVTDDDTPDMSYGYAHKIFEHTPDNYTLIREDWYDFNNSLIKTVRYDE